MTAFIHLLPKPNSRIQDHLLGIPARRPKIKCGVWCRWNKSGAYKLNFDGSAKDNLSAGGGFIRDVKGNYVAAFSAFYEKRDE